METWTNNYFYELPDDLRDLVFKAVRESLKKNVQRELLNKTDWKDYTKYTKNCTYMYTYYTYMYTYPKSPVQATGYPGVLPTKAELVQYLRDNQQTAYQSWKKVKLLNALMKF